jgi:hypothetical protein
VTRGEEEEEEDILKKGGAFTRQILISMII